MVVVFSCVDLALSGNEMLRLPDYEGCRKLRFVLCRDAPAQVSVSSRLQPSIFLQECLSSGVSNLSAAEMHATGFITSFAYITCVFSCSNLLYSQCSLDFFPIPEFSIRVFLDFFFFFFFVPRL